VGAYEAITPVVVEAFLKYHSFYFL